MCAAQVNADVAWKRIQAINPAVRAVQGNLDPMVLHGSTDIIKQRTEAILQSMQGRHHVMNLGHGIDEKTSEEHAQYFVDVVKNYKH